MTWDDDKRTFRSRPDIPTDERLTADEWNAHVSDQKDHADRHEAGGVDELVVDGLAGVLADPQPPQEEAVEDFVAGLLAGGDKVTTTYDDGARSLTVNTSALDAEEVDDRVDGLLTAGDKLSLTYDDANDTLTIDTSALDTEEVEDAVNALVAGGDGIATSYDDAADTLTLSIPDNSVTAAMLAEAYFTESEADDRFYNVSGDTLEGDVDANTNTITDAGHDEVDVPQTRDLTVADFEGGTLPDSYVGAISAAQIQSSVVLEGSRSLEISPNDDNAFVGTFETETPQLGDIFEYAVYLTDTDDVPRVQILTDSLGDGNIAQLNGSGVRLQIDASNDTFQIEPFVGATKQNEYSVNGDFSNYLNEWLSVRVSLGLDREISVTVVSQSGTEVSSVSATVDDRIPQAGGINLGVLNNSVNPTVYYDDITATRRLGQYYSNTQNGTVELGNDVQPSGGIDAGPQEAIVSDSTVHGILRSDDALSAGADVEVVEWDAGVGRRSLKAQADGQGGVYGLRSPLAERVTSDLSWQVNSLSQVTNLTTGANGGVFSFDIFDRPRRFRVDHDGTANNAVGGGQYDSVVDFESIGPFRITFHNVSFSANEATTAEDNFVNLGVSNTDVTTTRPDTTGSGVMYRLANGFHFAVAVDGGSQTANLSSLTVDYSVNRDIAVEYDGATLSVLVDGEVAETASATIRGDLRPFIQLRDGSETSVADTLSVEDISVEEL